MSSDQVCRICLSVDVRMISLVPLKDVYEKVTNFRLQADKKPVTACYVCVAELKRCFKFITKSVQAEDMMETLLKTQSDITPKSVAVVDREVRGLCHSYKVTPVKHDSFDSEYLVVVKSEPLLEEEIHVKEEGDPLTENMAVSEGEDDNSEDDIPLGSIQQVKSGGAPGSSQAQADVQSDSEQPPLPLEVNIKVEDNDSDDDATQSNEKQGAMPSGTQIGPEKPPTENTTEKHEDYNPTSSFGLLKIRAVQGYECTICHRRFNQNKVLKNHMRTHTGEKPYACKLCDSKFAQYSSLARHTRSHTGERTHSCDICKRGFYQKGELTKHMRTHTGEKPYTCEVCKKSFSLNKHLKCHMKVHTGEKPYPCDICRTKFREITHMKRHKETHNSEKRFECHECGNKFTRRCNIIAHLRLHTGDKHFECEKCKAKFYRSTHLKSHINNKHKKNSKNNKKKL